MVPGFPYTGTWYDHFTGLPTSVNSLSNAMTLQPGEWHLYLDTPLPTPDTDGSVPILVNVGCTDPVAQNYDASAEADNGIVPIRNRSPARHGRPRCRSNGVHVAGSFQAWAPSDTPMELGADSIYRTTVVAQVGSEVQYKFLNGNAWGTDEGVPADVGCPMAWAGTTARLWSPRPTPASTCIVLLLARRAPRLALWIVRLAIVAEKEPFGMRKSGTCVADGTSAFNCASKTSTATEQWPCLISSSCSERLVWCVPE